VKSRAYFGIEEWLAILRAEDEMCHEKTVRLRHSMGRAFSPDSFVGRNPGALPQAGMGSRLWRFLGRPFARLRAKNVGSARSSNAREYAVPEAIFGIGSRVRVIPAWSHVPGIACANDPKG